MFQRIEEVQEEMDMQWQLWPQRIMKLSYGRQYIELEITKLRLNAFDAQFARNEIGQENFFVETKQHRRDHKATACEGPVNSLKRCNHE